jgi:hypothetical protein
MKNILTPKVFLASLVIASVLFCSTFVYILVERPALADSNITSGTSGWTIIPALTSTPRPLPATFTPLPPTPKPTSSPEPGQLAVGVFVQPETGGDGLRIHTLPGLDTPFFTAFDSEVFQVADGPQQADGYTWWFLSASYDTNRTGWAAQDFLVVIPAQ